MKNLLFAALAFAFGLSAPVFACDTKEYRQFDFWLGKWQVINRATGKPAGENHIRKHLGECALYEDYRSVAGGYAGTSFNIYQKSTGTWHQSWVDNGGLLLRLSGGLDANGAMVLAGDRVDAKGQSVRDRITWTPNEDGSVRQHWELSRDNGSTWSTLFDGRYEKLAP